MFGIILFYSSLHHAFVAGQLVAQPYMDISGRLFVAYNEQLQCLEHFDHFV